MAWSITIGIVKGTVTRLHITFLLFLLWIAAAHYVQGGWNAAVAGVVFIALLLLRSHFRAFCPEEVGRQPFLKLGRGRRCSLRLRADERE
jgi:hypothetical protein